VLIKISAGGNLLVLRWSGGYQPGLLLLYEPQQIFALKQPVC